MRFLIILLLPILGTAQVVKFKSYTTYYNPKTLIPDSTIWVCLPHEKVADREASFHASSGRKDVNRDYHKSGYDLGHCADASDMNGDKQSEYESFDLSNVMPQLPKLNRITWLALEDYSRKLALQYGYVTVKTSWIGIDKTIGPDNVVVPLYCVKRLSYNGIVENYVMPNRDTVIRHPFTYYKVK